MCEQMINSTEQFRNERRLGDGHRFRRIVVPLVGALLVVGTVSLGIAGIGAGVVVPDDDSVAGQQDARMVTYTATEFRVSAPADASYYVVLTLQDAASGQAYRVVGGPFVGSIEERMRDDGTTIRKVRVLLE